LKVLNKRPSTSQPRYTRYMEITDETIDVLLGALADQLQAVTQAEPGPSS
jgi:hypothetical protein